MTPTIFAVSTPQGISAISIIRISGPESFKAADKLFRLDKSVSLEMRKTYLRKVFSKTGRLLDECLVIFIKKGSHRPTQTDHVYFLCDCNFVSHFVIVYKMGNGKVKG